MKTLLVTRSLPRLDRGGADMRAMQVVDSLARAARTAVFALHPEPPGQRPRGVDEWRTSSVDGLAGGPSAGASVLEWVRRPGGHPSDRWFASAALDELFELCDDFGPGVVIVDHLWLHAYIEPLVQRGLRVVLNTHNAEGALQAELTQRGDGPASVLALLRDRTFAIEARAVASVDEVWACSDVDAETLQTYDGCAPVVVIPNALDVGRYEPSAAHGRTVLFTGVFNYPPNDMAAAMLMRDVLPRLAADSRLMLVGREPSAAMLEAAARDPRVVVTGAVPDVRPFLADASVVAVPLREGGGTRFKLLEAFASGVPVVSTAKGAAGLDATAGEHYLDAETPDEFVDQVHTLWEDTQLGASLASRARALVTERYSWDASAARVQAALASS